MFEFLKRAKPAAAETRSAAQGGFTGQVMALREQWIAAGHTGMGDTARAGL